MRCWRRFERADDRVNIFNLGTDTLLRGERFNRLDLRGARRQSGDRIRRWSIAAGSATIRSFSSIRRGSARWAGRRSLTIRQGVIRTLEIPRGESVASWMLPHENMRSRAVASRLRDGGCPGSLGPRVVGLDFDQPTRGRSLNQGVAPVFEPGLEELLTRGLSSGNLRFSSRLDEVNDSDVLWVPTTRRSTRRTTRTRSSSWHGSSGCCSDRGRTPSVLDLVAIAGRLGSPAGTDRCQRRPARLRPQIAYSPENLRFGQGRGRFSASGPDRRGRAVGAETESCCADS